VGAAIAGVNDGLLASSQPEVAELVDVSGLIANCPSGNGVRNVVAVLDHHILGIQARVAAPVGAWGVEIHLVMYTVLAAFACNAVRLKAAPTRKASRRARARI
jgi:hypothetical protein